MLTPGFIRKKLQIEIEIGIAIGIEEKWHAEMRESISIPIAISIPTNPRPLTPDTRNLTPETRNLHPSSSSGSRAIGSGTTVWNRDILPSISMSSAMVIDRGVA